MNGNSSRALRLFLLAGLVVPAVALVIALSANPHRVQATGAGDIEAPATTLASPVTIDHTMVDAAQIPQEWLDAARQLDTFFAHRSLGNNILDGLQDLQSADPGRYTIAIGAGGPEWFTSHSGIGHEPLGSNKYPQTKIDGFDAYMRSGYHVADLAMMKFCPGDSVPFGDMAAADIWTAYRDMMLALEASYPDTNIAWWTFPLSTASDNRGNNEKAIFNAAVRQHCAAHGCLLFDIADIQSHDPDGHPVVSSTGHEAMWDGYSDDGGHLNEVGRVRVAQAFWWLLARAAGWGATEQWIAIEANPLSATIQPGATAKYELQITTSPGFTATVALAATSLPPGSSATFSSNPVSAPGSSHLSVTTAAGTVSGNYTITINADAGTLADSTSVALTVVPPATFTVAVEPDWLEVRPGETVDYTVTLESVGGFDSPVTLAVAGLPAGAQATFDANPIVPPSTTSLEISTASTVAVGSYPLELQGEGGGQGATAEFGLTVVSLAPTFGLQISPTVVMAFPNRDIVYTVEATRSAAFDVPIVLSTAGLPASLRVSWSNNPLLPDEVAELRVSVPRGVAYGETVFSVVGVAGDMAASQEARLIIYAGGFMPFLVK